MKRADIGPAGRTVALSAIAALLMAAVILLLAEVFS
jgi:hypothetical protein